LKKKFNVSNKITIIPHGNFDIYVPEKPYDKLDARNFLEIDVDDNVVLFFGVIRKNKGLELLLDSFEIAAKKDERLKLVIAGAPQNKELSIYYSNMIAKNKARSRIIYHGRFIPSKAVACYFAAADIIALPYKTIYHSGVVHLAYSFGVPVLSTNVGDFTETITDGLNGYILEKNDKNNMAEKLQQAFYDKNKLQAMGVRAKEISKKKYGWNEIGKKTFRLYEHISIKSE
jgi:glycosyltransferase involved in cell wall biosynthesis